MAVVVVVVRVDLMRLLMWINTKGDYSSSCQGSKQGRDAVVVGWRGKMIGGWFLGWQVAWWVMVGSWCCWWGSVRGCFSFWGLIQTYQLQVSMIRTHHHSFFFLERKKQKKKMVKSVETRDYLWWWWSWGWDCWLACLWLFFLFFIRRFWNQIFTWKIKTEGNVVTN